MWQHNRWGTHPITRGVTRTSALIAIAPAGGLALGVAAVGVGCVAAAGALTLPVGVLLASVRTAQQGVYYLSSKEYPVIVHLPWNRRVTWCESTADGEGEAASFLGYQGRHHPSGVFVVRSEMRVESDQSWGRWLKRGPMRMQGRKRIVLYFVPNGTTRSTLSNMLNEFGTYPSVMGLILLMIFSHPSLPYRRPILAVHITYQTQRVLGHALRAASRAALKISCPRGLSFHLE